MWLNVASECWFDLVSFFRVILLWTGRMGVRLAGAPSVVLSCFQFLAPNVSGQKIQRRRKKKAEENQETHMFSLFL